MEDKKKRNAAKWKQKTEMHGYCKPFTDDDYHKNRDIIFSGKKVHKIKFTHNSIYKSIYKSY
jgi:hypothetical protein